MVTEQIVIDVVRIIAPRTCTMESGETKSPVEHALGTSAVYRALMSTYSLADIETGVRWLELGGYVGYSGYGLAPQMVMILTEKGVALAERGSLEDAERQFVYQDDPYAAFVARQFRDEDLELFNQLRSVLQLVGVKAVDGRADGIDAFRGDILRKIRSARFFVCLLTHRTLLKNGRYASGVWLYQETGAAVALGKKPLVLVEDGMDDHFAGEMQKNYEYVPFSRSSQPEAFEEIARRIQADLCFNHIPLPRNN